jgi:hypothetical protein
VNIFSSNDRNIFPDHAKFIHRIRLEDDRFEIEVHRIRFETDTAMRPRIFRDGLLASIDLHGVLSAGVRVLDVPALDDDDFAIS